VVHLVSIAEARSRVEAAVRALPAEELELGAALGRVLAEEVSAGGDVPPFANAAMDGFALHAGAAGRRLRVVGESRAGSPAPVPVAAGEAIRISTGAMLPAAAEAVLELERCEESGGSVTTRADVAPGRNVRAAGDDMRAGQRILVAGTRLGAAELGVAAAAGRSRLRCAREPRVAVLVTGDELVEPGAPLRPGEIHDSNAVTLTAAARRAGAEVVEIPAGGRIADSRAETEDAVGAALALADVVVVSGGVSVGPHDHVKGVFARLGVQQSFWGVSLQPGRPTWFGTRDARLVFGLPGNPVSALVCFLLFVVPALAALQGAPFAPPRQEARLAEAVRRNAARDKAIRVRLDLRSDGLFATPTGPQGSHVLTSMLGADALAFVEAGEGEARPGEQVAVERI
jgi:molybdopterin molybdotransferase